MYEPLRTFFKQAEGSPYAVVKFFADEDSFFWLCFIENQLELSNEYVKKMETRNDASFAVSETIKMLSKKLENRRNLKFIPIKAREQLNKRSEQKQVNLCHHVSIFYDATIAYLKLWSAALDGTECLAWMSLQQPLDWENISVSLDFMFSKIGNHVKQIIDGKFEEKLKEN